MNAVEISRALVASIALLVLSGCASTLYEGKYDWGEGWRKGEVVKVVSAKEMERPRFYACVRSATPQQLSSGKFAVVKYRRMSRARTTAVPLQAHDSVAVGAKVYVKLDDCTTPLAVASPRPQSPGMGIGRQ